MISVSPHICGFFRAKNNVKKQSEFVESPVRKQKESSYKKTILAGSAVLGAIVAAALMMKRGLNSKQIKSPLEDFIRKTQANGGVKTVNLADFEKELKSADVVKSTTKLSEKVAMNKELSAKVDYDFLRLIDKEMSNKNFDEKSKIIAEHFEQKVQVLEQKLSTPNLPIEEIEDITARKTAYEHAAKNITPNRDPFASSSRWKIELASGETAYMKNIEEALEKEIALFKEKGIMSLSDLKQTQLDAEAVMKKYSDKANELRRYEIKGKFDPMRRLKPNIPGFCDPYLSSTKPEFYRIISPPELKNLIKTKGTDKYITANGYHTDGHYSCITANPDYCEQMFGANGLPIRLKFKTMNADGTFNMDLLDRIGGIKEERSIYGVHGYNFNDIDWNNVCVQSGHGWVRLTIDELLKLGVI